MLDAMGPKLAAAAKVYRMFYSSYDGSAASIMTHYVASVAAKRISTTDSVLIVSRYKLAG